MQIIHFCLITILCVVAVVKLIRFEVMVYNKIEPCKIRVDESMHRHKERIEDEVEHPVMGKLEIRWFLRHIMRQNKITINIARSREKNSKALGFLCDSVNSFRYRKKVIDDTIAVTFKVSSSNAIDASSKVSAFQFLISLDKAVELDYQWIEFDDVRYHVQVTMKNPNLLLLSVSLPNPPPEAMSFDGLPLGAIEAIKTTYGTGFQILDPPRDGFSLTLKLNFSKVRPDEESIYVLAELLTKLASIREVVMGAPLKIIFKHLASRTVAPELDRLVAIMHRPNETFFLVPQADKVTVAFPMRFKDSVDTILATSFLKEFVEARRAAALNTAPSCSWSPTAPQELEGAPKETLSANAGFVTFVIFPRHVEGKKLDRTVWNLSTFHAYVSYHVKVHILYRTFMFSTFIFSKYQNLVSLS
ncbi:T17H7.13 [Arabidopsis thaliana]|nr:T17H7.13 [Arabidopsis thaliana]